MRPDAIIVNLDMPGLSGKDLMIALTAQRVDTPHYRSGQKRYGSGYHSGLPPGCRGLSHVADARG